ncbi:MAG: hypothetical protein CMB22_02505 [Euryarchaeota archaeon]|nr:hypothetical protein [Euryarchaeota archaeon]
MQYEIGEGPAELALREHIRHPDNKPTADGSFLRISSITTCDRKQILDGMGVPKIEAGKNAVNGFVAREVGNTMHDHIQQAFNDKVPNFECEVPVSISNCMTSGHADGVYEGRVLEIKTMRNYGFRKARQEGPKEEHLFQACAYALGLGLTKIHLVYVCTDATPSRWKDSARAGDMVEWVYGIYEPFDESGTSISVATTYFLEDHARMAKTYLNTGVIPEGLRSYWETEVPWECNYCSHFDICEQYGDIDMLDVIDLVIKETDESVK